MATPPSTPGSALVVFPFSAGPHGCHLLLVTKVGVHWTLELQGTEWKVKQAPTSDNLESVECRGCSCFTPAIDLITTVSPRALLHYRCTCKVHPLIVVIPQPTTQAPTVNSQMNPGCIPQPSTLAYPLHAGVHPAYKKSLTPGAIRVQILDDTPSPAPETPDVGPSEKPMCPECQNTGKVQLFTSTQPCKLCTTVETTVEIETFLPSENFKGVKKDWKVRNVCGGIATTPQGHIIRRNTVGLAMPDDSWCVGS